MARRGNSTSIILLLVCLILLVGGVAAGYIAIDKKIIENPFASLLQGEPMTLPSSEPISVPATSTEETDFFMKTDRPKPGTAPFLSSIDEFNLTPGTTINCTRFVFPGDSIYTTYRYMGGTEVRKYPDVSTAQSWHAPSSTAVSCRGLTKGSDLKGNWPTGTTVKCAANDKKGSSDTLYSYINPGKLMAYGNMYAVNYYDPNWESTVGTIPDCSDYTLDSSRTIYDPTRLVGEIKKDTRYKIRTMGPEHGHCASHTDKTYTPCYTTNGDEYSFEKGTNGNYPYTIYNHSKGTWCIADTDTLNGWGSAFYCPTGVDSTDARAQFNIETQGNTYTIKANNNGLYCGAALDMRCTSVTGYPLTIEPA
jgi:hypothetical protein